MTWHGWVRMAGSILLVMVTGCGLAQDLARLDDDDDWVDLCASGPQPMQTQVRTNRGSLNTARVRSTLDIPDDEEMDDEQRLTGSLVLDDAEGNCGIRIEFDTGRDGGVFPASRVVLGGDGECWSLDAPAGVYEMSTPSSVWIRLGEFNDPIELDLGGAFPVPGEQTTLALEPDLIEFPYTACG